MYLGPLCYVYALNCHLDYLAIPETRPLCKKSKICLFYLYSAAKSEIQIFSSKHETCLVWSTPYHWPVFVCYRIKIQFESESFKPCIIKTTK